MFDRLRKMLAPKDGPAGLVAGVTRSTTDPPKRGTREHLEVYEASPWQRAVSEKVANAVACCEFEVVAQRQPIAAGGRAVRNREAQRASTAIHRARKLHRAKQQGYSVEVVMDHPMMAALDNPNPYMDRHGLLKITELHVDLVGDAYWLKQRGPLGQPIGYWPIPPHWIVETPRVDEPTFRFSYRAWQGRIAASEIAWLHEPAPANPYTRGTGIGWALADEIQVDEYASKMAAAFFFNRARPDFIFATGLGDDETKRLEQDWIQKLQGFWRAHRPYFLAGSGADQVDLQKQIREFQQPTMEQLVYPNLRKVERDIILQTWGVPPELFGILESSNRATIETAEYTFARQVTAPKCERFRGFLQRQMIEDFDERGIVHCDSPVVEDKEFLLNAAKAAPWALTTDEWRKIQGLAQLGDEIGASRMIPLNSYLTDDPLNPDARPQGGGSAMRATDVTPALPPGERN